jgi:hypothetical protein
MNRGGPTNGFSNRSTSTTWERRIEKKNIVTDGDSQEISQLDDAIAFFLPEAYRIRCSWHIIDRGWNKKVKVALGGKSRKKRALASLGQPRQKAAPLTELNKTARTTYRWMFSWAQPSYCETEEEYFLSKALFMKFVASRQVREVLGSGVGEAIIKFARETVIPQEERMAYYKRHGLFHLEAHTNCGHEGTNNGMKHCATPVMPQNCLLDRAVQTLHLNATMKQAAKASTFVTSLIQRNRGLTVQLPNMLLILVKACYRLSGDFQQPGLLIVFLNTDGYSSILPMKTVLMSPLKMRTQLTWMMMRIAATSLLKLGIMMKLNHHLKSCLRMPSVQYRVFPVFMK